jgi:predicted SPOUT superfamily RNA methylase MTH1
MLKINHILASLILGVLSTLLLIACGENKVVQCNKFAQVNERVRVSLAKYAEKNQVLDTKVSKDLAGFTVLARERSQYLSQSAIGFNSALKIIEGLSVQDDKLKSFKDEYINITRLIGESTQELSNIASKQGQSTDIDLKNGSLTQLEQDFETVSIKIATSGKAEKKLMDNFNAYCRSSQK